MSVITRRAVLGVGFVGLLPAQDLAGIRKAVAQANAGDIVQLPPGTYQDFELVLTAEGTAEKPIIVRAMDSGTVVFRGKSRVRVGGKYWVVEGIDFRGCQEGEPFFEFRSKAGQEAEGCVVRDCSFREGVAGEAGKAAHWVSLYGVNNRVERCYLAGKKTLGPTMVVWVDPKRPNFHRIERNYFGARPALGQNGGETLRVGVSQVSMSNSRTEVFENYFEECDGEIEVISNKSCENIYRNNTFRRCDGMLTLRHGNRCLVEGNVFWGEGKKGSGGVRIIGEDHRVVGNWMQGLRGKGARAAVSMMKGIPDSPLNGYWQVKRARVEKNVIVDCAEAMNLNFGERKEATLAPVECVVENNEILEQGQLRPPWKLLGPKDVGTSYKV